MILCCKPVNCFLVFQSVRISVETQVHAFMHSSPDCTLSCQFPTGLLCLTQQLSLKSRVSFQDLLNEATCLFCQSTDWWQTARHHRIKTPRRASPERGSDHLFSAGQAGLPLKTYISVLYHHCGKTKSAIMELHPRGLGEGGTQTVGWWARDCENQAGIRLRAVAPQIKGQKRSLTLRELTKGFLFFTLSDSSSSAPSQHFPLMKHVFNIENW